MAKANFKPIIPKDWVGLERVINEIWRLLNENITISEINDDILGAAADIATNTANIATNASNISALQSTVAGLDPVAGSNTQVQFNDGGNMGASSDLTFNKTTKIASVNGTIKTKRLLAGGVS